MKRQPKPTSLVILTVAATLLFAQCSSNAQTNAWLSSDAFLALVHDATNGLPEVQSSLLPTNGVFLMLSTLGPSGFCATYSSNPFVDVALPAFLASDSSVVIDDTSISSATLLQRRQLGLTLRTAVAQQQARQLDAALTSLEVQYGLAMPRAGETTLSDKDFEQKFQAPDTGYQHQFVAAYQKGAQSWTTTFNDVFYLTSRSGRCYGKLGIEVLSDVVKNGTIPVILNSYLNPDGSRNLDINPQLVTEARP
jgi:hypothetical protein